MGEQETELWWKLQKACSIGCCGKGCSATRYSKLTKLKLLNAFVLISLSLTSRRASSVLWCTHADLLVRTMIAITWVTSSTGNSDFIINNLAAFSFDSKPNIIPLCGSSQISALPMPVSWLLNTHGWHHSNNFGIFLIRLELVRTGLYLSLCFHCEHDEAAGGIISARANRISCCLSQARLGKVSFDSVRALKRWVKAFNF